jgi:hypothetical protein
VKIGASAAIAVFFLAACTSTPSSSPPPPPAPPAHAAGAVIVAPVIASAAPAASVAQGEELRRKEVAAKANELGYHVEVRNDKRLYCHSDAPLGSRFEKKVCVSEASFGDMVRSLQQNQPQPRGACSGPGCVAR